LKLALGIVNGTTLTKFVLYKLIGFRVVFTTENTEFHGEISFSKISPASWFLPS